PVRLGALAGSRLGAKVLVRAGVRVLRRVFSAVIAVLAAQMILKGLGGGL
ncbi:MAG: sulfite exporter TauE/SafE family protein, partial [Elusimicrobia bacterium]|nr:sulfite exporter TauE/SafE family protein [Elusimicrobiota bacterium]